MASTSAEEAAPAAGPTWRERLRQWTKPPRRLTFTRAGKFFMLLTLAVGAGALNTGNNLLFLLLGMMLSAIIASGVLSEAVLRKLHVQRDLPRRFVAGRGAPGAFVLENPRGYLSLNIEVSERNATCELGPRAGDRVGHEDVSFWKFWKQDNFDDDAYVAIARVFELEPHSKRTLATRYTFPTRGRWRNEGMRLATRFPFGLFHKVVDVDEPRAFVVYPTPSLAEDWLGEVAARFGDISRRRAGQGEEYFGLRDWREGEDRRQIHWRSSARRGELVVREFEEQEQRAIELVVLNATGRSDQPAPESERARFERALERTAGLLEQLASQRYRIALRTLAGATEAGQGASHLDRMLHHLALLELHEGRPPALPASRIASSGPWRRATARVAIGPTRALEQCPEAFDLALPTDEV